MLVTAASTVLLSISMFTALLGARMQSQAEMRTDSLKHTNTELQQIAFRPALTGLPDRLLLDAPVSASPTPLRMYTHDSGPP